MVLILCKVSPMKRLLVSALLLAAVSTLSTLARAQEKRARREPASAEKPAQEAKFVRLTRDENRQPLAMETAVMRYTSPEKPGVAIDLVGAVHVGDKEY